MTPEAITSLLVRYGLRPDKKFGQNFLMDESVLDDMIAAAGVSAADTVLEVGPGIGNLTGRLLAAGARVLAVEKDERFRPLLAAVKKQYKQFEAVFADVMRFDFVSELQKEAKSDNFSYKVVANIPYYVTGKLLQLVLQARVKPRSVTVLVQKEVAENMAAEPGHMNLLGLSVQLAGRARLVRLVPAHSFYPPPKVQSAVVHVDIYAQSPFARYDERVLFRVARACFSGKRKQIHNSLAAGLRLSPEQALQMLKNVDVAPSARPQDLSVEQFIALSKAAS